jgi:chemotaxis signal transduction protein
LPADDAVVPGATPLPSNAADSTGASESRDVTLPGVHLQRACIFAMGHRTLAVDVRETREVMTLDTIGAVPGAPAPLLGVANLRGTVLAVADAGSLLGLAPKPVTSGSPAIVLSAGRLQAAVPIDRVLGLEWFDAPQPADDLPDGALKPFATGIVPRPEQPAVLLDVARLLAALRAPWAPAAPEAQA